MASVSLGAAECKATFLQVIDRVARDREPVIVTKRGKPTVMLVPMPEEAPRSIIGSMRGTGSILGDIVSPVTADSDWEAMR